MKDEKMIPHFISVIALVIFIVLGLACVSSPATPSVSSSPPLVFDAGVPEDQCAIIMIPPGGSWTINTFSGSVVGWRAGHLDRSYRTVRVPSGTHEIIFTYRFNEVSTFRVNLTLNFQAGHVYSLYSTGPAYISGYGRIDIGIYNNTTKQYTLGNITRL